MIIECELENEIPSFIYYKGEKIQINYQGQPQTSSLCQALSHRAADCPTRKPQNYYDFPTLQNSNTKNTQNITCTTWIQVRSKKRSRDNHSEENNTLSNTRKHQIIHLFGSDTSDSDDEPN